MLTIVASTESKTLSQKDKSNMQLNSAYLYQRFFKAAMFTTLSAGALWGALLLITIGLRKSFTAISLFDINAHGHAQIYGWVGLFVMGASYYFIPKIKETNLWRRDLAITTFYLMITGIMARVIAEPLYEFPGMVQLAVISGLLEITAIAIFIVNIVQTIRNSEGSAKAYDYYIYVALGWFLIQSIIDLFHLYTTITAPTKELLLQQVSTWQAVLRDIQIHGFAMTMILAVSQHFLVEKFGLPQINTRRSLIALIVLTLGVVGESSLFVIYRITKQHVYAGIMYLAMIMIAAAVIMLIRPWWSAIWNNKFRYALARFNRLDRSFKFITAAYRWLFISLALLLLMPFYNLLTKQPFSHAYYGATRHAITVGFISLMIVGVATTIVSFVLEQDQNMMANLTLPFWLINIGCALRVTIQIATDLIPASFPLIGISGVMEVAGLTIWIVLLWQTMNANGKNSKKVRKLSFVQALINSQ